MKYTFLDRFLLSPIATIILIMSLIVSVFGIPLFLGVALFSVLWITFRWEDYQIKKSEQEKHL